MKINKPNMGNFKESIKQKAETLISKIMGSVKESAKNVKESEKICTAKGHLDTLKKKTEKVLSKYEDFEFDGPFYKNIHFNFHHFATICLVALLAFSVTTLSARHNTAIVSAESLQAPTVEAYNEEAINISYGDNDAIAEVAKDILGNNISTLSEPEEVKSSGMNSVYQIENYMVTVSVDGSQKLGEMNAVITIQDKETYNNDDSQKLVVTDQATLSEVQAGTVYQYNVKLHIVDNEGPKITLYSNDITLEDVDDYDATDMIKSITDNVDGVISMKDVKITNDVKTKGSKLKPGTYYVKISATDESGNKSTETLIVRVWKTSKTKATSNGTKGAKSNSNSSNTSSNNSTKSYSENSYTSSYSGANAIVAAAYAQLGVSQDCTSLVSNCLAAAGIYYHGWPAGYLSLGTVVSASEAQPGDLIYYANGGCGVPHIAVYVGGGMAIHGGWNGYTTVKTTAYVGSGPVFIRIAG